jgi:D-arabinose 1-dehydrogenase-like Zn-dependent alcohol dehydrogenase
VADMLAGRPHAADRRFALERVPVPEPGHGRVRVRVRVEAAGVCLSDVHLVDGTLSHGYL